MAARALIRSPQADQRHSTVTATRNPSQLTTVTATPNPPQLKPPPPPQSFDLRPHSLPQPQPQPQLPPKNRDGVQPEDACVLPYYVRGCAAWDSGDGWLVLFDQFGQLQQFSGRGGWWAGGWAGG